MLRRCWLRARGAERPILCDERGLPLDSASLANGWVDDDGLHCWMAAEEEGPESSPFRRVYVPGAARPPEPDGRDVIIVRNSLRRPDGTSEPCEIELLRSQYHLHAVNASPREGGFLAWLPLRIAGSGQFCELPLDLHDPAAAARAFDFAPGHCRILAATERVVEYAIQLRHLARPVRVAYERPPEGWTSVDAWLAPSAGRRRLPDQRLDVAAPAGHDLRIKFFAQGVERRERRLWTGEQRVLPLDNAETMLWLSVNRAFWRTAMGVFTLDESPLEWTPTTARKVRIWLDHDGHAISALREVHREVRRPPEIERIEVFPGAMAAPLGSGVFPREVGAGRRQTAADELGVWSLEHPAPSEGSSGTSEAMFTSGLCAALQSPVPMTGRIELYWAQRLHIGETDALEGRLRQVGVPATLSRGETLVRERPDAALRDTRPIAVAAGCLARHCTAALPLSYALLADLRGRELRLALCVRGSAFAEPREPILLACQTLPVGGLLLFEALGRDLWPHEPPGSGAVDARRVVRTLRERRRPGAPAAGRAARNIERFFGAVAVAIAEFGAGAIGSRTVLAQALQAWPAPPVRAQGIGAADRLLSLPGAPAELRIAFEGWGWAPLWDQLATGVGLLPGSGARMAASCLQHLRNGLGNGILTSLHLEADPLHAPPERSWTLDGLRHAAAPLSAIGPDATLGPCGIGGETLAGTFGPRQLCGDSPLAEVVTGDFRPSPSAALDALGLSRRTSVACPKNASPLGHLLAQTLVDAFRGEPD